MINKSGRYLLGLVFSVMVTLGLLWSMQALIAGGKNVLTDAPRGNVLDFIRLKKEQQLVKKERKPQKPVKPKEPPPPMAQPKMQQSNPNANAVSTNFAANIERH